MLLFFITADNVSTPTQINLFLSYGFRFDQFHHLQTITLSNPYSSSILDRFQTDLEFTSTDSFLYRYALC